MIGLNIQFKIIIFSYMYGLFFYYSLFLLKKYLNISNCFFRYLNTITFFLFTSLGYCLGLEIICDGILHIYSLFIVIITGYACRLIAKTYK